MGYPAWFEEIPLCVHTMLWHTVMISVGTYLLFAKNYGRRYLREMLPATAVFLGSVALATACNLLLTPLTCESPNPLNLYYMNPRVGKTHYFLIGDVWKTLGWGPAMFAYVLLFIFVGATLVFGVARAIHWFSDARRNGKIPSFSKK